MTDFERLGVFYLGREVASAPPQGAARGDLLLYPSRQLTTHAVCVGMTGSGKTGLLLGLLEEAALDGIPAIVVDPKGDLANLLLTFPELRPADFAPWVDPDEAARLGLSADAYAEQTAQQWTAGLAEWGQDGARITRLRAAAELAIYTPASRAGRPLALLRALDAPADREDPELLREQVDALVGGLLGLAGVEADPIRSREHILLARLVADAWAQGRDATLPALVQGVLNPPFTQVGILDLESFYPQKDRAALAMALNNLIASPAAAAWADGEPLDVKRLLWTPEGKPRIAILSIAHLGDAQRMYFVSALLAAALGWMRTQTGTSSLRALLVMDEIAGYFPPVAAPPSKAPMLTLLKQARAYGVGVVLATQNPVDLDYKGLSNCGTWFVGRLQTERDKARLLDGLEGAASGALDRGTVDGLLSSLGKRTFLLHSVHADAPRLFQTRWTMSFLRGPLSRDQIRALSGSPSVAASTPAAPPDASPAARPALPPDLAEDFFPGDGPRYIPHLHVVTRVHYVDTKAGMDRWERLGLLVPFGAEGPDWERIAPAPAATTTATTASFSPLPPWVGRKGFVAEVKKSATGVFYRACPLRGWRCPELGLSSTPGESEGELRARVALAAREARDRKVEALRQKLGTKLNAAEARVEKARARVQKEQAEASAANVDAAVSFGSSVLGALFGRSWASGANVRRAASTAKQVNRTVKQRGDVGDAESELTAAEATRDGVRAAIEAEVDAAAAAWATPVIEATAIAPRKADLQIERIAIGWVPVAV